jgi:DNA repair protein RecO (recombination protein O)
MEDKVQGFVLQSIRYGDSSLVVKIYTQQAGLQTYMVKGVTGRAAHHRAALFQPMTFLRFVQSGRSRPNSLSYLKEPELQYAYQSIPLVMNKSAILIYLSELLSHTLTQTEQNEALYAFVFQSVVWLDLVESHYANFPLYFTLELTRFLGFYPHVPEPGQTLFDMMEGRFVSVAPPHPYWMEREPSALVARLLQRPIDEMATVILNGEQRNMLLDGLLTFVRLHAPMVKGLQSHEILKEVLR